MCFGPVDIDLECAPGSYLCDFKVVSTLRWYSSCGTVAQCSSLFVYYAILKILEKLLKSKNVLSPMYFYSLSTVLIYRCDISLVSVSEKYITWKEWKFIKLAEIVQIATTTLRWK